MRGLSWAGAAFAVTRRGQGFAILGERFLPISGWGAPTRHKPRLPLCSFEALALPFIDRQTSMHQGHFRFNFRAITEANPGLRYLRSLPFPCCPADSPTRFPPAFAGVNPSYTGEAPAA